ncbi:MAG: helix-turn-helix domain-containing protein [Candidatus Sulfotelmatobacter sp.]
MEQTPWLNAREAAQYLRVAHRTVLQWAKEGRIPAHRLSGTARVTWRFRADELDGAMMAAPSAAKNGDSFNATGK